MRAVKALTVILQKSFVSALLMIGATSIIFFSLRAAPGTAVDAYSSLSTPKEDIAQLRQELGFTIVEPLRTLSGTTDVLEGLSLVGAYEGVDELEVRLTVSTTPESASYIVEWSSADKSSLETATLKLGDELVLPDGFRLKAEKLVRLESPRELRFSALSLDNKPFRAFYEWLAKVMVGDFGQSQVISQNSAVMGIAGPAFLKTLLLSCGALIACMLIASGLIILRPRERQTGKFARLLSIGGAAPSFVVGLFVMLVVNQVVYYYWNPAIYVPPVWWPVPKVLEGEFVLAPTLFAGLTILLGDGLFADYSNGFRSDYNRIRSAPFIAAIQSKGASVTRHVFRNMIVPTVDAFAARLPLVLGSVIIVENMFGLTGGGWYLLEAAKERDVPLVVGLSVLFTGTGIFVSLAADVIKTIVDPREADHGA